MNWITAINDEVRIVFRTTLLEPFQRRSPQRGSAGWFKDRHLRKAFFLGLPVLIVGIALFGSSPGKASLVGGICVVLAANLVWLAVAAWSRERERVEKPTS
jgi:hypothetical protein